MPASKFLKNNFIFLTGTAIAGLLGYFFHFAVSRNMSVAQYGELQSLLSILVIFGVFNSAISYFTVRHASVFAAHNDNKANQAFINYLVLRTSRITFLLLLAFLILSPLLASFLHFSSYLGFVVISFAAFFSTITTIYFEVLRSWHEFLLLSLTGIAAALVKFASGMILALYSHKTAIVSFSLLLAALTSWLLAKHWSEKKISGGKNNAQESIFDWKNKYFSEINIKKSAIGIFAFSLALVLVSNLDIVLVKYFSSAEIAGYYGAFALLGKIILWLNLAVIGVMLPQACADGYVGKRPGKYDLLSSYGLMALIGSTLMIIYYLAPNFVVNIFFGKKYIFNTHILWLFGLMSFFLSVLTLEASLSFAKHDFRVVYLLSATLVLMVTGIIRYHTNLTEIVLAFSLSFLLGYVSITILNLSHEKRRATALNR